MTVNSLRKSVSDEQIVALSKSLIKNWKKLLDDQKAAPKPGKEDSNDSTNGNSPSSAAKPENGSSKLANSNVNNGKPVAPAANHVSKPAPTNNTFSKQLSFPSLNTSDSIRLKCREMLTNALSVEFADEMGVKDEILEDPENLAAKIEDCIFKEFRDTNMKYKNRIRSRVSNLKDNKNPDLRLNVLRGQISVQRIASMTSEVKIDFALLFHLHDAWASLLILFSLLFPYPPTGDGFQRDEGAPTEVHEGGDKRCSDVGTGRHADGSDQVSEM